MKKKLLIILYILFITSLSSLKATQKLTTTLKENKATNTYLEKNNSIKKYNSIMFSTKHINDILKYMPIDGKILTNILNEDILENRINIMDENNVNIYLNSIFYISKDNWSIWVNGTKITNLNNGEGEIVVTKISPLITFLYWKIGLSRWAIINANKQIPSSKYKEETDGVKLFFSLSPNQTYIPANNNIIEGRIKYETETTEEKKNTEINQNNESNENSIFF